MKNWNKAKKEERKALIEKGADDLKGKNSQGEDMQVFVAKGKAMRVDRKEKDNENWVEVIYYDADGEEEGVEYKHILSKAGE